jgi:ABC-type glycerol-3-phosphate transport system substrate-binding protein
MTLRLVIRPALVLLAAAGLTACGAVESDPNQFETMARSVADIPLDGATPAAASGATRPGGGMRPALKVEVLTPHALWDARDADLRDAVQTAAPRLAAAAAPAVVEAATEQVSGRVEQIRAQLRPAAHSAEALPPRALVQLGAYSSEDAARAAWARLQSGQAAWALDGLSPVYEAVEVGGRTLTRLKVRAPAAGAAAVCAAAGIDDPWCRRTA